MSNSRNRDDRQVRIRNTKSTKIHEGPTKEFWNSSQGTRMGCPSRNRRGPVRELRCFVGPWWIFVSFVFQTTEVRAAGKPGQQRERIEAFVAKLQL